MRSGKSERTRVHPWYTPYQFAGNTPIWAIDLDGKEEDKTTKVEVTITYTIFKKFKKLVFKSFNIGVKKTSPHGSGSSATSATGGATLNATRNDDGKIDYSAGASAGNGSDKTGTATGGIEIKQDGKIIPKLNLDLPNVIVERKTDTPDDNSTPPTNPDDSKQQNDANKAVSDPEFNINKQQDDIQEGNKNDQTYFDKAKEGIDKAQEQNKEYEKQQKEKENAPRCIPCMLFRLIVHLEMRHTK